MTQCSHRIRGRFRSRGCRFGTAKRLTPLLVFAAVASADAAETPASASGNQILEVLNNGGEVMYVILGASILGLAFILEAAFRIRSARILPGRIARQLEDARGHGHVEGLLDADGKASVHRVLHVARRWHKGTTEQIQAAIEETVDEALWRLKRSLRPIGVLANVAPLLGLLGTVIGIIRAFEVVAEKGALGDPTKLAGGISQALLTTCFGLIVAIPMLLAYHYFTGKAESLLRRTEELVKETVILPPE